MAKHIEDVDIKYWGEKSFSQYSKYIIQERALPDIRDGLKPVQRRILYSMFEEHHFPKTVKSAKVVGEVMGNYHPHGDCLRGDTPLHLTNGKEITIEEAFKQGKDQEILALDSCGKITATKAHSFRIGQYADKTYKIVLYSGEELVVTNNHPIAVLNAEGGYDWVKAENLTPNSVLSYANINKEDSSNYLTVKGYKQTVIPLHHLVFDTLLGISRGDNNVIHHKDKNKFNNSSENLALLTRKEHALLHKDYIKGLDNGRKEMYSEDGKYYKETKERNKKLITNVNKLMPVIKAVKILAYLENNFLELTEENYNNNLDFEYNASSVSSLISKGYINSFDDLLYLHNSNKGITKAYSVLFETESIISSNKKSEDKKISAVGVSEYPILMVKAFADFVAKNNKIPEISDMVNSNGNNNVIKYFNTTEDYLNEMFAHIPVIKEIIVEDVDNLPMYDFTVDEYHNMFIPMGKNKLVAVHNSAIYESMIHMTQPWEMGFPLVKIQGNNGSIDGDVQASMRYTEVALEKFTAENFMEGINKKGIVPFVTNYDDTRKEPTVLPIRVPNLLVNGTMGIASGFATNIPPFNLTELITACIKLLENTELTDEEFYKIVPAPDFPTGGVITDGTNLAKVLNSGKGAIKVRSKYKITELKNGKKQIVITELPFKINKKKIVTKIDEIARNKELAGLLSVEDESTEKVKIILTLAKDADTDVVLGYLFKKTDLQKNFNLNLMSIDMGVPKLLGVRAVLEEFNKFRTETIKLGLQADRDSLEKELHLLEGFAKFANNLDYYLGIIKASKGKADAVEKLIAEDFSEIQANAIVVIPVYRLAKVTLDEQEEKLAEGTKKLAKIDKILASDKLLLLATIKSYKDILEKYPTKRKTKILQKDEVWEVSKVDTIKDEDVVVSVTKSGYLKRSSVRSYNASVTDDNHNIDLAVDDSLVATINASTKDGILVVTNKLRYYYIAVHALDDLKWKEAGRTLALYGNNAGLASDEYVLNVFAVTDETKDDTVVVVRDSGKASRVSLSSFIKQRAFFTPLDLGKTNDDEQALTAFVMHGDEGFIGYKDTKGKVFYHEASEITAQTGVKAKGMLAYKVDSGSSMEIVEYTPYLTKDFLSKYLFKKSRGKKGFLFKKVEWSKVLEDAGTTDEELNNIWEQHHPVINESKEDSSEGSDDIVVASGEDDLIDIDDLSESGED